jgi:putative transposase
MDFLKVGYKIGTRKVCSLVGHNRATYYYQRQAKYQSALKKKLRDLAASRVRYGY